MTASTKHCIDLKKHLNIGYLGEVWRLENWIRLLSSIIVVFLKSFGMARLPYESIFLKKSRSQEHSVMKSLCTCTGVCREDTKGRRLAFLPSLLRQLYTLKQYIIYTCLPSWPVVATIVASWYILEVQSQHVGPGENDEAEAHAWRWFYVLSYSHTNQTRYI